MPNNPTGFWAAYQRMGMRVSEAMGVFSMGLAVVYVLCITANVLMRYAFNAPMSWVSDLGFVMLPLIMAPCLGVAAARGMLIVITFVGDQLPRHLRIGLVLLTRGITAVFLGLVAWKMTSYGLAALAEKRATLQLDLPLGPVWIAVAFAFALAVPLVLAQPFDAYGEKADG
jgi:TRAP-type C4-dicarboxylate transport system permease small subunit